MRPRQHAADETPRGLADGTPARTSSHGSAVTRMTEHLLIERAAEGDPLAVRTLYERYAPRVYAVVRRIAGDDDVAQDWAQEAWIRAFRALPSFRRESRFSTWIHRIAVNAALQSLRKSGTRDRREGEMPDDVAVHPRTRDVLLEDRLEAALDRVPEGMRKILILHDVEGYTHEEIGELLGINPGTSKSQLFKGRAKMRELLRGTDAADLEGGTEAWNT
jgi:RNA polymerase sigma-70 factor, ECF subfamily